MMGLIGKNGRPPASPPGSPFMVLSFILFWPIGLALLIYLQMEWTHVLLEALWPLEHA